MSTLKERQIGESRIPVARITISIFRRYWLDDEPNVFLLVIPLAAIKQMLNLNTVQNKSLANEPVWKVLIYDRVGQDIISPLIAIRELRELGVTLHM